ncbi:MAG: non-canonical purine NTP pyrophosphatase [bacterium]
MLATANAHKVEEYQDLFPGIALMSLADLPPAPEVVEDAPDFEGNALIKARDARGRSGQVALADDSGLCVDALDGAPGVYSARYAPGRDADRVQALLAAMAAEPDDRTARFVCVIAVAGVPDDVPLPPGAWRDADCVLVRGEVEGRLAHAPRGTGGFGYDPIFELPGGAVVAELPAAEKHAISHRGVAARAILPLLRALVGRGLIEAAPTAQGA